MAYRFLCDTCDKRCDGKSRGVYNFESDAAYSGRFERALIQQAKELGYFAKKTDRPQYPDVEIYDREGGRLICFIEVKAQRRTFMKVQEYLPNSGLVPSETVVLNQSDLEHYIAQSRVEAAPIYLLWVLSNRHCVVPEGEDLLFFNRIEHLERIFRQYGDRRRFRRRSGQGDVVNGEHKGVVVNYHFSLNELVPFDLRMLLAALA